MAVVLSRNPPAQPMLHTANANRISASGMPDMPHLPQWRPRDGRTAAYHAWQHALQNAERDLGLRAEATEPNHADLAKLIPHIDSCGPLNAYEREVVMVFNEAVRIWHAENAIYFDLIRPSLVIDGPHLERDLRNLTAQTEGKHGRNLRAWALKHADLSTVSSQSELHKKLQTKLPATAGVKELEIHSAELYSSWLGITGNDPNEPSKLAAFVMILLNSLPSQPAESHLASVRKWLAEKITESSPLLTDIDNAIDVMVNHAENIGLPMSRSHVPARDMNGRITEEVYTLINNCKLCKANICQSEEHGGPDSCVSRSDSKVPISALKGSELQKAMVVGLRERHEADKSINLKTVDVDPKQFLGKVPKVRFPAKPKMITMVTSGLAAKGFDKSEITDSVALEAWLEGTEQVNMITVIGSDTTTNPIRAWRAGTADGLDTWRALLAADPPILSGGGQLQLQEPPALPCQPTALVVAPTTILAKANQMTKVEKLQSAAILTMLIYNLVAFGPMIAKLSGRAAKLALIRLIRRLIPQFRRMKHAATRMMSPLLLTLEC